MKLFLVCLLVAAVAAVAYGEVESTKAAACNLSRCFHNCIMSGYRGGYCVGKNCVCQQERRSFFDAENLPISNAACNFGQCNLMCMTNGYRGGYCLGNTCVCQGKRSLFDAENLPIPNAACNFGQCYRMCITNGYRGGSCVGNTCVCQGRRSLLDAENLAISNDDEIAVRCDNAACQRLCVAFGWAGRCYMGSCQCFRFKDIEIQSLDNQIQPEKPVNKMAACDGHNCVLYCQRMGKNGGACVGGRCLCF